MDTKRQKADLILIGGALLLLSLPFINQNLHNDDFYWIEAARRAIENPITPFAGELMWEGRQIDLFTSTTHPPLHTLFLGLIISLSGELNLPLLHLASLIFPITGALSMYFLATKFTGYPLLATFILIASPAFMVMSHNFHGDLPNLSLILLSITSYIYGSEMGSRKLFFLSGFSLLLATLTMYQSALLLLILPSYTLITRKSFRSTSWAYIIPVAGLALWCAHNFSFHGKIHLLSITGSGVNLSLSRLALHGITMMTHLGGGLLFPPLIILCWITSRFRLALFLFSTLIGLLFIAGNPLNGFSTKPLAGYGPVQIFLFVSMFATGLTIFSITLASGIREMIVDDGDRGTSFLACWFLLFFTGVLLFLPFVSTRYLLPLFPCTILLGLSSIERGYFSNLGAIKRRIIQGSALCALITGVTVSLADYELAKLYSGLYSKLDIREDGPRVWANGITNFLKEAEREGATVFSSYSETPRRGELIIESKNLISADPFPGGIKERLTLLKTLPLYGTTPLRTMDYTSKAGFYTYVWGFLPYSISLAPLDEIYIYRVNRKALPE